MSNSTITSSSSIPIDSSTTSSLITSSSSTDISTSSPDVTVTSTAPTADATTNIVTSFITAPTSDGQSSQSNVVVVITSISSGTVTAAITRTATPTSDDSATTSSGAAALSGNDSNTGKNSGGGGGLGTAGTTAIAVVIPVVVVALLVLAGILLWRKRKQKKENAEQRRKEVEDYGFNPNNDPTIPAVAQESPEMTEDNSGYRGWGGAAGVMSNRKASTTLSGGQHGQYSDSGSNTHHSPSSPGNGGDCHSGDPLVHSRGTTGSDDFADGGFASGAAAAGAAGAGAGMLHSERNAHQVRRGPSNASSRYSTGAHSETSDDHPPMPPIGAAYDFNPGAGYGFGQHGPYGDGTYGGGGDGSAGGAGGMPVVRDVSARRNTRIQQPGQYQQGNSGIAQNF